jgi:RsiW-degrading membrane proteinase PrsW (M82 family)
MSEWPGGALPNVPEQQPPTLTTPEYATPGVAYAAAPPRKRNWVRFVLIGVVIALIAGSGIAVLAVIGYSGGVTALLVGAGAAVLPVPFLVFCFLWLDRYEPEPTTYLALAFGWGACVATGVALLVNTTVGNLFDKWDLSEDLVAVITAPIIEESMKAAGPILLFILSRKTFSGIIDGIVYCGLSATGFAMVENILYLGIKGYATGADEGGAAGGARQLAAIFVLRILLSGFAHPLFTSMTGIALGIAARSSNKLVRVLAPVAGLLVAMMLHGSWNLMSTIASKSGYILLYGYFAVMVPIFISMVCFALWLRAAEGRLVVDTLPEYVRMGWLTPPEVAALATIGRRLSARRWAKRVAGDPGAKAMKAFQFDATRLALLRDRMRRGDFDTAQKVQDSVNEERTLLDALMAYRYVFVGRDPMTPRAVWDGTRYHVTFPDGVVRAVNPPVSPVTPVPVVLGAPFYR